jgi:cation:H+ antiporter
MALEPALPYLLMAGGFFLLVKGADYLVRGGSELSTLVGVSPLFIGLAVAALGTSAPEAAVSIKAALSGYSDISIGNILGSNVANFGLALGLAAAAHRLPCSESTLTREIPYSLLAALVLLLGGMNAFAGGSGVSRPEGLLLLLMFGLYLYYLMNMASADRRAAFLDEDVIDPGGSRGESTKALLITVGGIAAVVFGGHLAVDNAVTIATRWGVSQTLISVTIVALGTSLPEVVTTLTAVARGEYDIALGNAVGSNIFNILFVLGITASIRPIDFDPRMTVDLLFIMGVTVLLFLFLKVRRKLERWHGIVLVGFYAAYIAFVIVRR